MGRDVCCSSMNQNLHWHFFQLNRIIFEQCAHSEDKYKIVRPHRLISVFTVRLKTVWIFGKTVACPAKTLIIGNVVPGPIRQLGIAVYQSVMCCRFNRRALRTDKRDPRKNLGHLIWVLTFCLSDPVLVQFLGYFFTPGNLVRGSRWLCTQNLFANFRSWRDIQMQQTGKFSLFIDFS